MGILFVVAIHTFGYLRLPVDGAWYMPWLLVSLNGVSMFFFADGWLHAMRHRGALVPRSAMTSVATSLRRLGVPWAVFSCIYLAAGLVGQRMHLSGGPALLPNGISDFPSTFWHGVAATQLYFLPALFVVRCASWVLQPAFCGKPITTAIFAASLLVVWRLGLEPVLPHPRVGTEPLLAAGFGLGFAGLGWAVAEAELAGLHKSFWLMGAVSLGAIWIFTTGALATLSVQCACLLAGWWLVRSFTNSRYHKWVAALGRHTMEIYLLHMPIFISIISTMLLFMKIPLALAFFIDVAATIACSLGLAWILQATCPASLTLALGITNTRSSQLRDSVAREYQKSAEAKS